MAQTIGFDASQVPQMLINLENAWPDSRANEANTASLQTDTKILKGVFAEQTVELQGKITENDGCTPVKVEWLESAGATVIHNASSTNHTAVTCEIDGDGPASNKAEYQIVDSLSATLKIKERDCGNNFTFDQKFQRKFLATEVALVNELAKMIPPFLLTNAGISLSPGLLGTYAKLGDNVTDDKTQVRVPAGNFNAFDIVPFMTEIAELNRLRNPAVFDGGNLYYPTYNAPRQKGTYAGDAGQENHFDDLRMYVDRLNFLKTAGLADSTFLVDRGAIAVLTAAFGPIRNNNIGNGFNEVQFRTPLLGLSFPDGNGQVPVEADTIFRRERLPISEGSDRCEDWNVWELKIWYIMLVNPLMSANDGVNGIIRLKSDPNLVQKGTPMQKAL